MYKYIIWENNKNRVYKNIEKCIKIIITDVGMKHISWSAMFP